MEFNKLKIKPMNAKMFQTIKQYKKLIKLHLIVVPLFIFNIFIFLAFIYLSIVNGWKF